jgi:hypothetical protein
VTDQTDPTTTDQEPQADPTIVSVSVSADDLLRLMKAFADGQLAKYGVTAIEIKKNEADPSKRQWSARERSAKGHNPVSDDSPTNKQM